MKSQRHSPVYYNPYPYYNYGYDPYYYDRYRQPEPQQPQIVVIKEDDDNKEEWFSNLQIPTIVMTLLVSYLIWGRSK